MNSVPAMEQAEAFTKKELELDHYALDASDNRPIVMSWAARYPTAAAAAMATPEYRNAFAERTILLPPSSMESEAKSWHRSMSRVTYSPEIGLPFYGPMPFGGAPHSLGWLHALGYPPVWTQAPETEAYMTALAVSSGTYGNSRYTASVLDMSLDDSSRPMRRLWEGHEHVGVGASADMLSAPTSKNSPAYRSRMHEVLTDIAGSGSVPGMPPKIGRRPSEMYDVLFGTGVTDHSPSVVEICRALGHDIPDREKEQAAALVPSSEDQGYRYGRSSVARRLLLTVKTMRAISASSQEDDTRIVWTGVIMAPGQRFGDALESAGLA